MPTQLKISEQQEAILQGIIRRAKSPQNLVKRVKIVLAGQTFGRRNQQIAQELGVNYQTVQTWRSRWQEAGGSLAVVEAEGDEAELENHIVQVLSDEPRSGTPPTFTAEQICQIVAVACQSPQLCERPITEWTPRELADEVIKRKIVVTISSTQVGRFLKRGAVATPSQSLLAQPSARGRA